jgi:hypothetical protein
MTTFPRSPRLLKGALVTLDPLEPIPSVVVFQYNPDLLTRTLRAQTAGADADRSEVLRLKGPPEETIKLDVEIDATDQLEQARAPATQLGLHATLAALELLLYPKASRVIANEALSAAGVIEIVAPAAPLTLFVWGVKRVLPVRLTDFTITEEAFDPALNPVRARVSLGLRVLNYADLGLASPGGALFMGHQLGKEAMAKIGSAIDVAALTGVSLGG